MSDCWWAIFSSMAKHSVARSDQAFRQVDHFEPRVTWPLRDFESRQCNHRGPDVPYENDMSNMVTLLEKCRYIVPT